MEVVFIPPSAFEKLCNLPIRLSSAFSADCASADTFSSKLSNSIKSPHSD